MGSCNKSFRAKPEERERPRMCVHSAYLHGALNFMLHNYRCGLHVI